jgi:hypothetical protein
MTKCATDPRRVRIELCPRSRKQGSLFHGKGSPQLAATRETRRLSHAPRLDWATHTDCVQAAVRFLDRACGHRLQPE